MSEDFTSEARYLTPRNRRNAAFFAASSPVLSLSLWLWLLRPVSYHDSVSQVTTNEPTKQPQRSAPGGEGGGREGRGREGSQVWKLASNSLALVAGSRSLALVEERWFLSENAGLTDWLKYYSPPIRSRPARRQPARGRGWSPGVRLAQRLLYYGQTQASKSEPAALDSSTGGAGIICIEHNTRTDRQIDRQTDRQTDRQATESAYASVHRRRHSRHRPSVRPRPSLWQCSVIAQLHYG